MSETMLYHSATNAEISPKRRQIAEAAEALFMANGYGAVSMDQVARTANVSKATLYAHFASKEALFVTIMQDKKLETPFLEGLFPDRVTDLRAELEMMGERLLRFMLRERTLRIYRMALAEAARFPELGAAFYANGPCGMRDRFIAWLGVLEDAGLVRVPEGERGLAAEQFMALMRSGVFLRRSLSVPPEASDDEIGRSVRAAVRTWLRAYGT
jgi:TetR/AcrR family transcriptional regulator, mexJK operon transcriptional repressor